MTKLLEESLLLTKTLFLIDSETVLDAWLLHLDEQISIEEVLDMALCYTAIDHLSLPV
jgi:hypothetical protein